MIDLSEIKNISFDVSQGNLDKAEKVYRVKDLIGLQDNPLAIPLSEARSKIDNFATSSIVKANSTVQSAVNGVRGGITALDIVNKTVKAYRAVKPAVKLAVNIGGIWLNFANVGEIAQDTLQLLFREAVGKGKIEIEKYITSLLNKPILVSLGDDDKSASLVIGEIGRLEDEIKSRIGDYLVDLKLEDFMILVRMTNERLTRREEKTFSNFSYKVSNYQDVIGIQEDENYIYLIYNNEVKSIDKVTNVIETIIEKEDIKGFYSNGIDTYLVYGNTVEKNESSLGTISGELLSIDEFEDTILFVTDEKVLYGDSLGELYSGDIKDFISTSIGMYFIDGNKIYQLSNFQSSPIQIYSTDEGEIDSIEFYDYLFFTHKVGNKTTINKIIFEREFIEEEFPESNFSFYKKASDGNLYGFKGSSLVEIKYDNNELIYETLTTALPGDISDIETIIIDEEKYFITAFGPSLYVAKEGYLNVWEEKYPDYESIGVTQGIISSIKNIGDSIYISSLKNLIEIKDTEILKTVTNYTPTPTLDWNRSEVDGYPAIPVIEDEVPIIEISLIKTYDDIIFKIFDEDTISYGKKIEVGGNTEIEVARNIYNFHKKGNNFYYSQGKDVYENDTELKNLIVKGNILGITELEGQIIVFTDNHYYLETDASNFTRQINSPFELRNSCKLLSDEETLLIYDNYKLFNYNSKNDSVKDLIQTFKSNVVKVENTSKGSYVFTDDLVYVLNYNNRMSVSEEYQNGYKINSHFGEGKGIAPFDARSNILTKTSTPKIEYVESLSDEFIEHFSKLMKEIPESVLLNIKEKILDDVLESGNYESEEEQKIEEFIREYLESKVLSLFSDLMEHTFSLNTEDNQRFLDLLLERLSIRGNNDITREFYFVAFEFVKEALENAVYGLLGIEIWGLVWSYYERHKYEWGAQINSGIDKSYVALSEYSDILDLNFDIEVREDYNSLLNIISKGEIENYTDGKTGELEEIDKEALRDIVSSKNIGDFIGMVNYSNWIDSITDAAGTFYKPKQQYKYEDIIDKSSMEPIQWHELPDNINRPTFLKLLNSLLDRVKEEMKKGINTLIEEDGVPCYSCINASSVYKGIEKSFKDILNVSKVLASKKLYNATDFENVPTSFYVPNSINTPTELKRILDNQTVLYKSYLMPFIDAVIEASEEDYEGEEL